MNHQIILREDGKFSCLCGKEKMTSAEALKHQKNYLSEKESKETSKYYKNHNGDKWEENRKKAKERDGYKCVDCGITDEEHKKREDMFGEGLHVHHKKPVREFENPEKAHKLENLVTLCAEDHRKREF